MSREYFDDFPDLFVMLKATGENTYQGTFTDIEHLGRGPGNPSHDQIFEVRVFTPAPQAAQIGSVVSVIQRAHSAPSVKMYDVGAATSGFVRTVQRYNRDGSDALLMWGITYSTNGNLAAWTWRRQS